jgi:hypothetical protein
LVNSSLPFSLGSLAEAKFPHPKKLFITIVLSRKLVGLHSSKSTSINRYFKYINKISLYKLNVITFCIFFKSIFIT